MEFVPSSPGLRPATEAVEERRRQCARRRPFYLSARSRNRGCREAAKGRDRPDPKQRRLNQSRLRRGGRRHRLQTTEEEERRRRGTSGHPRRHPSRRFTSSSANVADRRIQEQDDLMREPHRRDDRDSETKDEKRTVAEKRTAAEEPGLTFAAAPAAASSSADAVGRRVQEQRKNKTFARSTTATSSTRGVGDAVDVERARKRRYVQGLRRRGHSVKTCGRVRM